MPDATAGVSRSPADSVAGGARTRWRGWGAINQNQCDEVPDQSSHFVPLAASGAALGFAGLIEGEEHSGLPECRHSLVEQLDDQVAARQERVDLQPRSGSSRSTPQAPDA